MDTETPDSIISKLWLLSQPHNGIWTRHLGSSFLIWSWTFKSCWVLLKRTILEKHTFSFSLYGFVCLFICSFCSINKKCGRISTSFFQLMLQKIALAYFSQHHVETRENGTVWDLKGTSVFNFIFEGGCYLLP